MAIERAAKVRQQPKPLHPEPRSAGRLVAITRMQGPGKTGIWGALTICELAGFPSLDLAWQVRNLKPLEASEFGKLDAGDVSLEKLSEDHGPGSIRQ